MPITHRSEKQIEASRLNGSKSTGPKTPEGKERSARRIPKDSSLAIIAPLLAGEDPQAFEHHVESFIARMKPLDHMELRLVRKLASIDWRHSRITAIESSAIDVAVANAKTTGTLHPSDYLKCLAAGVDESVNNSKLIPYLNQRETALDRSYAATLKMLRELRRMRPVAEEFSDLIETTAVDASEELAENLPENPKLAENNENENPSGTQYDPTPQV